MARMSVMCNGHTIEAFMSEWSGKETVLYDGQTASEKRSFGLTGIHTFSVDEEGETAFYEVEFNSGIFGGKIRVRRNGILVGHN